MSASILVSGLINLETTLRVDGFPLAYNPVNYPFFGVNSTISGVGLNIALALAKLGDQPCLVSMVGDDLPGHIALEECSRRGLDTSQILPIARATAQSVILFDRSGRRQIHVDLKDIQECTVPGEIYNKKLREARLAVLCNINFSRSALTAARQAKVPIATDVHTLSTLDDPYEQDFLHAADILFMSHENLPEAPGIWTASVFDRFPCRVLVIGMGKEGAFLAERGKDQRHYPAVTPRTVVNTIGTGDALFASFLHYYLKLDDADQAMRRAVVFAGYKAGSTGSAEGFLDEAGVERLL